MATTTPAQPRFWNLGRSLCAGLYHYKFETTLLAQTTYRTTKTFIKTNRLSRKLGRASRFITHIPTAIRKSRLNRKKARQNQSRFCERDPRSSNDNVQDGGALNEVFIESWALDQSRYNLRHELLHRPATLYKDKSRKIGRNEQSRKSKISQEIAEDNEQDIRTNELMSPVSDCSSERIASLEYLQKARAEFPTCASIAERSGKIHDCTSSILGPAYDARCTDPYRLGDLADTPVDPTYEAEQRAANILSAFYEWTDMMREGQLQQQLRAMQIQEERNEKISEYQEACARYDRRVEKLCSFGLAMRTAFPLFFFFWDGGDDGNIYECTWGITHHILNPIQDIFNDMQNDIQVERMGAETLHEAWPMELIDFMLQALAHVEGIWCDEIWGCHIRGMMEGLTSVVQPILWPKTHWSPLNSLPSMPEIKVSQLLTFEHFRAIHMQVQQSTYSQPLESLGSRSVDIINVQPAETQGSVLGQDYRYNVASFPQPSIPPFRPAEDPEIYPVRSAQRFTSGEENEKPNVSSFLELITNNKITGSRPEKVKSILDQANIPNAPSNDFPLQSFIAQHSGTQNNASKPFSQAANEAPPGPSITPEVDAHDSKGQIRDQLLHAIETDEADYHLYCRTVVVDEKTYGEEVNQVEKFLTRVGNVLKGVTDKTEYISKGTCPEFEQSLKDLRGFLNPRIGPRATNSVNRLNDVLKKIEPVFF